MNEILDGPAQTEDSPRSKVPSDMDMTEVNTDGWNANDSEVRMDLNSDSPFQVVSYQEEHMTK